MKIKLSIVSFGNEENIKFMIKNAFGDIFDDIIGTGIDIPCFFFEAKNKYFYEFMKKYNLLPNEILFFDDNKGNIKCAKKININVCHNPPTGITPGLILDELKKMNKKNEINNL